MNASATTGAGWPPEYGLSITLEQAARIMAATEKEAQSQHWPMVIAIVDTGGHLVMLHKMDQAQIASVTLARLKAETAANFRRPTKVFEEMIAGGGAGLKMLSAPGMLAMEGGLPILKDGKVIGGIGVSGMQSGQDAQVARAGLKALEAE